MLYKIHKIITTVMQAVSCCHAGNLNILLEWLIIIEVEPQEQFYRYHKIYALTDICVVTGTQESACQMLTCSWDRTSEDALPEQPSGF